MINPIISVSNLSKQYQGSTTKAGISDISFELNAGEVLAVIGESGSGKSTLLKCLYGLIQPDKGLLLFENKPIKGPNEQLIPGHPNMKMVTQDFSLNTYASVYDNIAAMLSNTDVQAKKVKTEQIMKYLHLDHLSAKRVVLLSGGEQQRVAIAKALVSDTKVLLLDEPFSQLDTMLKNQLRLALRALATDIGVSIIFVSHDVNDAFMMADRMLIIKDGVVLDNGKPRDLYRYPAGIYTARMLGNASVFDSEQAAILGLKTIKEFVAIYPEWVKVTGQPEHIPFTVKEVYFMGAFELLVLERAGLLLKAIAPAIALYKKDEVLGVRIDRFLEY